MPQTHQTFQEINTQKKGLEAKIRSKTRDIVSKFRQVDSYQSSLPWLGVGSLLESIYVNSLKSFQKRVGDAGGLDAYIELQVQPLTFKLAQINASLGLPSQENTEVELATIRAKKP